MSAIVREVTIGDCRLILGDSTQIANRLEIGAILTDPPYGISYSPAAAGGGIRRSDGSRYEKTFTGKDLVIGDAGPFDPGFILAMDLPTIIWGGNHFASRLPDSKAWLIWDKRRGTSTNDFADCEIAWTNLPTPARCLPHMWNGMLRDSERGIQRVHPTQKPIAVMEWCLGFLPPDAVIGDFYMGSGTTGVACAKQGRKFVGCEIDPGHFETACHRVEEAYRQPDMLIHYAAPKPIQETLL